MTTERRGRDYAEFYPGWEIGDKAYYWMRSYKTPAERTFKQFAGGLNFWATELIGKPVVYITTNESGEECLNTNPELTKSEYEGVLRAYEIILKEMAKPQNK